MLLYGGDSEGNINGIRGVVEFFVIFVMSPLVRREVWL